MEEERNNQNKIIKMNKKNDNYQLQLGNSQYHGYILLQLFQLARDGSRKAFDTLEKNANFNAANNVNDNDDDNVNNDNISVNDYNNVNLTDNNQTMNISCGYVAVLLTSDKVSVIKQDIKRAESMMLSIINWLFEQQAAGNNNEVDTFRHVMFLLVM